MNCGEVSFLLKYISVSPFLFIPVQAVPNHIYELESERWRRLQEQRDRDYIPKHKSRETRRTPCKTRLRVVRPDFEGYASDSGVSIFVNVGSPERQRRPVGRTTRQDTDSTFDMAKPTKTSLETIMEMFLPLIE